MFFWKKSLSIRIVGVLVLIFSFAMLGMGRVASLTIKADSKYLGNTVDVFLESGRGDFFYSDGAKITGNSTFYANIFLPCDSAKKMYFTYANEQEKTVGEKAFENNKPAILKRSKKIKGVGIYNVEISNRYENISSLEHILGYINGENEGVAGLEKGYNDILKSDNNIYANFYVNAKGEYLLGTYPKIVGEKNTDNVILTVNSNIQKICEGAMSTVKKGAVIVSEIKSGKIRAALSKPSYDINNISQYLTTEDSPFINRALSCYNVGSVFKPLIATAICENDKQGFTETCSGSSEISGINFHCYYRSGHGLMGLDTALRESCNCYFYSAVRQIEPQKITSLATSLMFDIPITIAKNITSQKGVITSSSELENPAAAANFSIGQGSVLLSPLAITNLYSAIANDGMYFMPSIIEAYTKNGACTKVDSSTKTTVMSKSTAALLKQYLSNVVTFGTGKNAMPAIGGAAGKTATAQTGKYSGETEKINSWFCGFFPLENPKYTVTVFLEDSNFDENSAAVIFKNIADSINALEG